MSSIIKPRRSGGVIGTIGPIGGSGVFSLQERHALSVDNFDDVSLYLKMNGASGSTTFYDSSQYGHTVTANGNAAISTAQSKFGGASVAFDGAGDYLTVPDDDVFFFTGDFTIEGWYYMTSSPNSVHVVLAQWAVGGGSNRNFEIASDGTMFHNRSGTNYSVSAGNFLQNQWVHFAYVLQGTNLRAFRNGLLIATTTIAGSANNSTELLGIGAHGNGSFTGFSGYLDDLRITKGIARYDGSITPPQREFLP